jgi:vacuolar protein-sorting-associated protein 4
MTTFRSALGGMGGMDMGRKRLQEGRALLDQAVAADRDGRMEAAKRLYTDAQLRFAAADNEPTLQRQERVFVAETIEKCKRRIAVLSEALAPPSPPMPVPVAAPPDDSRARMESAILVENPNVHWDDIAGLAEAKRQLIQTVILPAKIPHFFTGPRAPWRGILLYGPPGTGKSFLAKATATEASNATFLTVATSDLLSRWLGESEKLIAALFETARERAPSVVFIDEIDSLLRERGSDDSETSRRIKSEFLVQMDGVGKSQAGVLVLAATNTPWDIDPAARRRFEKRIYIPLPDREARLALVHLKLKGLKTALSEGEIEQIADWTEGYSGADIAVLCRDAAMTQLNRIQSATYFCERDGALWPCNASDFGAVAMTVMDMNDAQLARLRDVALGIQDFEAALQKVRPSVSARDLGRFDQWTREFGLEGN